MKFCQYCGQQMEDGAVVCAACGKAISVAQVQQPQAPVQPQGGVQPTANGDAGNGGFAFLCFLIPLLGLILFLVWKDQYPLKAKSCGKGAIIGVSVYVGLGILFFIIIMATGASMFGHIVNQFASTYLTKIM